MVPNGHQEPPRTPRGSLGEFPQGDSPTENMQFKTNVNIDPENKLDRSGLKKLSLVPVSSEMVGRKLDYGHSLVGLKSTPGYTPNIAVARYAV